MAFNPSSMSKVLVRATNWVGDAVMSLPAIRAIRQVFPHAHLAVLARPSVADLYARETAIDRVIPYPSPNGLGARREFAARLRAERFDGAILLQNAFDAALMVWLAGIPERIGYRRDGRGVLLTCAIEVPEPGDIPRHERFYYLELLRRAGLIERFPESVAIRLDGIGEAREAGAAHLSALGVAGPVIGISPGAAYGDAKRWLPERFAESGRQLAGELAASVLVFGSAAERPLCETVAEPLRRAGIRARNLAGETSLREFIDLAAACRLFLTNDSGAMHVASALGVPTVAVFGATDDTTTGPTGLLARVVREHAECSPCLLRECPIDHRCMTRVAAAGVTAAASLLLSRTEDDARNTTHGIQMDTRNKIVNAEAPPRACIVVTGAFDVVLAEDARQLAEIRASHPDRPLLVVVLPLPEELLPQRARAELVAALRMVDYVVTADDAAPDGLLAALQPAQLVRLEEAQAVRKRQLMEHVHRRQTS